MDRIGGRPTTAEVAHEAIIKVNALAAVVGDGGSV
jgi:hypothetical protein